MPLETLATRPAPTRIGPKLLLDALVRESHELNAEVTEFPVETGGVISDHVRLQPREVSVEGVVTNNPVRFLGGIFSGLIRGENPGGVEGPVIGPALNLTELAFAELERMYQERELIEVVTPRKRYENMALMRLSIPKDRTTGDALRFSALFREVTRVETSNVTRRRKPTAQERSQPVLDEGKKTPPPATPQAETRVQSALFRIFN
jgi:hypothetical protein